MDVGALEGFKRAMLEQRTPAVTVLAVQGPFYGPVEGWVRFLVLRRLDGREESIQVVCPTETLADLVERLGIVDAARTIVTFPPEADDRGEDSGA
jgi:hypothetical protein